MKTLPERLEDRRVFRKAASLLIAGSVINGATSGRRQGGRPSGQPGDAERLDAVRAKLIGDLRSLNKLIGRPPAWSDIENHALEGLMESPEQYAAHFGNIHNARTKSGLKYPSIEHKKADLADLKARIGHFPLENEIDEAASRGEIMTHYAYLHVPKWKALIHPEGERMVRELGELSLTLGRPAAYGDIQKASRAGLTLPAESYIEVFGSIPEARRAFDGSRYPSKEEKDADLVDLAERLRCSPGVKDISEASARGECLGVMALKPLNARKSRLGIPIRPRKMRAETEYPQSRERVLEINDIIRKIFQETGRVTFFDLMECHGEETALEAVRIHNSIPAARIAAGVVPARVRNKDDSLKPEKEKEFLDDIRGLAAMLGRVAVDLRQDEVDEHAKRGEMVNSNTLMSAFGTFTRALALAGERPELASLRKCGSGRAGNGEARLAKSRAERARRRQQKGIVAILITDQPVAGRGAADRRGSGLESRKASEKKGRKSAEKGPDVSGERSSARKRGRPVRSAPVKVRHKTPEGPKKPSEKSDPVRRDDEEVETGRAEATAAKEAGLKEVGTAVEAAGIAEEEGLKAQEARAEAERREEPQTSAQERAGADERLRMRTGIRDQEDEETSTVKAAPLILGRIETERWLLVREEELGHALTKADIEEIVAGGECPSVGRLFEACGESPGTLRARLRTRLLVDYAVLASSLGRLPGDWDLRSEDGRASLSIYQNYFPYTRGEMPEGGDIRDRIRKAISHLCLESFWRRFPEICANGSNVDIRAALEVGFREKKVPDPRLYRILFGADGLSDRLQAYSRKRAEKHNVGQSE